MTPPPEEPPARRRAASRAARGLLAAALGVALLDVAASLVLIDDGRYRGVPLPPYGAITHPRQAEWLEAAAAAPAVGLGAFDPELGWTVTPDFRGGPFNSNSIGARGQREYAPAAPPGTLRVVCYGDSFTYCDEVADPETWPAALERADPRIEALNLGVGGYGTDQALLRFRRHGRLDADVVTIGILLENVGRNANRYRPLWYTRARAAAAKPRFVLDGRGALELVPVPYATRDEMFAAVRSGAVLADLAEHERWRGPRLGPLRHSSLARFGAAWWARRDRDVERLWTTPDEEAFRVTAAILRAFHREARESGARAAPVLVFPRERDLERIAATGRRFWADAVRALEDDGVPVIDLTVPLFEQWDRRRAEPGRDPIYAGGHLSPRSNQVVAAALLDWLRERGLAPE